MPYIGPWYRCRRCHELKPWTRRYFVVCKGKLMQPCKQCAKANKQQPPKQPKRTYTPRRSASNPAPKGYLYMCCADGIWRRIGQADKETDHEQST